MLDSVKLDTSLISYAFYLRYQFFPHYAGLILAIFISFFFQLYILFLFAPKSIFVSVNLVLSVRQHGSVLSLCIHPSSLSASFRFLHFIMYTIEWESRGYYWVQFKWTRVFFEPQIWALKKIYILPKVISQHHCTYYFPFHISPDFSKN